MFGAALWVAAGLHPAKAQKAELPEAPSARLRATDAAERDRAALQPLTFKVPAENKVPAEQSAPRNPAPWWKPKPPEVSVSTGSREDRTGYQWRGLIWQSLEFNLVENGFRVSADHVMRDTLAHRPFWHNYWASLEQYNMRRWNDGDTFIVNYIGHSMHGAVAAYIEMQNSPTDARLQFGDPGYGKSLLKGFLWATVFSTHSEISPAGEAGVGNAGGFTYGVNCLYTCTADNFHPGDHYTNNTGWVDFIVSPTAGMVWVVTEDVLDKYLNNRLVAEHPDRFWPLVVRGGLTPARSFANILRLHVPWYRDFEQPTRQPARVHWFPSEEQVADREIPHLQLAPFWSRFTIAANTPGCFNCRQTTIGGGLQTTVKLRDWLGLDTAISFHPGASSLPSDRAGGDMLAFFAGLSATKQWRYYAVHVALRPGMVRFSDAYLRSPELFPVTTYPPRIATHGGDADGFPIPGVIDANGTADQPPLGPLHHFVWDWNLALDYRLTRRVALRLGLEDAVVRYRTNKVDAPGLGQPPYLSWLSKEQYLNRGNFTMQLGPVFSF